MTNQKKQPKNPSNLSPKEQAKRSEMLEIVKSCTPRSLTALKYKVLFPGRDPLTRAVLDDMPRTWSSVFNWMESSDEITEALYPVATPQEIKRYGYPENTENLLKFPLANGIRSNAIPYIGKLGDQQNEYHLETVSEHAGQVAASLIYDATDHCSITDDYSFLKFIGILGMLHDVGKKYTAVTNNQGKLSFLCHAELSAYIAGLWLFHNPLFAGYNEPTIWVMIAAIHQHMEYKTAASPYQETKIRNRLKSLFPTEQQTEPAIPSSQKSIDYVNWVMTILSLLNDKNFGYTHEGGYIYSYDHNVFRNNLELTKAILLDEL